MSLLTRRKRFIQLAYCFLFTAFTSTGNVAAQAPPPGDEGGDPDEVPLDGGVSLLIAAGAAYGAKKVYEYRKGKGE